MPWICVDCGREVNSVTIVCNKCKETGRCGNCQRILDMALMPPPKYKLMRETNDPGFKGFKQFPHPYVPTLCPYCMKPTEDVCVGVDTGRDNVYTAHFCKGCKVFYGVSGG